MRTNVIAGVTTAAVVVPSAMAYSSLANLPAQAGLYTALAALAIYALLGTSPVLSVTITSTLAIMTADAIGDNAQAASTLALLTGMVLVLAGLLRLGFVTALISTPALLGFKAGMGLWIASSQLGKLLGFPQQTSGFVMNIQQAWRHLGDLNLATCLLSAVTVASMLLLMRRWPAIPAALVAVGLGIGAQLVLQLDAHGVELVDRIPRGLPLPALPSFEHAAALVPAAVGLALMSGIESISAGRAFAPQDGPRVRPNREFLALGMANAVAGLLKGMPAGGGTSQTAVNSRAGATARLSGLVTAVVVVLALTVLTGVFALLPQATLGSLIVVAAIGLFQPAELRRVLRVRRRDGVLALIAFAAVLFLGALPGLAITVVASMLTLLYQANHPRLTVITDAEPGLMIVRPEGGIYFANADRVQDAIFDAVTGARPRTLLLDASVVPDVEYTALLAIMGLRDRLRAKGIEAWVAAINPRPLAMLQAKRAEEGRAMDDVYSTVDEAVAAYRLRYPGSGPSAPQTPLP